MCDTITINHKEYTTIRDDGACLCNSTVEEIGAFVFKDLNLQFDESANVTRNPFGWEIKKGGE